MTAGKSATTSLPMDNSSILRKYATRTDADDSSVVELETEDVGSFGFLRGIRDRCVMLELRKRGGNVLAISYSFVDRITFDPSEGIVISVGGPKVVIKGRNLNVEARPTVRLFEGLTRHRVPWIQEQSQADAMEAGEGVCVVEQVQW